MKKNIIKLLILPFVFVFSIFLSSCEKKTETDNETQSVVDNSVGLQNIISILPYISDQGLNYSPIKKINACTTVTQLVGDTTDADDDKRFDNGPISFYIDFGNGTCASDDGSTRSGKIKVILTKKWSAANDTIKASFAEFKMNDVKYSGSLNIIRRDSIRYKVDFSNVLLSGNEYSILYSADLGITQNTGYSTKQTIADDGYKISGSTSGTTRQQRTFSSVITTDLVKKVSCNYLSEGKCSVTPNSFKARAVNYGNGNCDDEAIYVMNGETITFKLN